MIVREKERKGRNERRNNGSNEVDVRISQHYMYKTIKIKSVVAITYNYYMLLTMETKYT